MEYRSYFFLYNTHKGVAQRRLSFKGLQYDYEDLNSGPCTNLT